MSQPLGTDTRDLPVTTGVVPPRTGLLGAGRPAAQRLIRWWWRLERYGVENVPATGPVVMAANHVGWLDGPFLAICAPRPVHVLTKLEMFRGPLGPILSASGQIPLDRWHTDVNAIRVALRALQEGLCVGVFPEGTRGTGELESIRAGAGYLALVTGAPVVPVSFLGTRVPGGHSGSIPPRGTRIAITFGEPVRLARRPWPRTRRQVEDAAAEVTAAIRRTMRRAEVLTGMALPGPLGARPEKRARWRR